MTLTDKLSHAAERKAFETILDNLIKKGQTQDAAQVATDLVNMVEKLHSDVWSENSFPDASHDCKRPGRPNGRIMPSA